MRQICSEQVITNQISSSKSTVFHVSLRFDGIHDSSDASSRTTASSTPSGPIPTDVLRSPMPVPHKIESLSETKRVAIASNSLIGPKCPQLRRNKIELYSDTDIQSQQCWLEKERMKFWNAKAQALEISKETQSFKKTDLVGAVDVSWAYRKVDLLNIKISELEIRQERYTNVFHEKYLRSDEQSKNSSDKLDLSPKAYQYKDEISKYLYFIERERKKIMDLQKLQGGDGGAKFLSGGMDAENRIHAYLHQLKCNSDYLLKALSVWEKRLDNFESKNISPAENIDDSTYEIDTIEMIDLAADVFNTEY